MNQYEEFLIDDKVFEYQKNFNKLCFEFSKISDDLEKGIIIGQCDIVEKINDEFNSKIKTIETDLYKINKWFDSYTSQINELDGCFINNNATNVELKEAINIYNSEL